MNLTEKFQPILESSKYEPLKESDKNIMALVLENTSKEAEALIKESGTTTGDIAQFTPIMIPLVRRVFPKLIANELLGIQPMTMPTGFIYSLYNRFVGNGINPIKGTNAGQVIEVTNTGLNVNDAATSAAGGNGKVVFVDKINGLVLISLDDKTKGFTKGETFGAGGAIKNVYSNEAIFHTILPSYSGPVSTAVGEVMGKDINEVGFDVAKKAVEVQTRKLKARYTLEMYEDLKAQHGLLADEELMSLMQAELQTEIDREVLKFVNDNATHVADPFAPSTVDGRWEIEKYRVQAIKIDLESANVGIDTKRGNANVIVCSPKVAVMLSQAGSFKFADSSANIDQKLFNGLVGTYDGRYRVIVDQYATSDYITVLYKGSDRRDGLGFFCPYVPLSFQKLVDPESGAPSIMLRTRYGLTTNPMNAEWYARNWAVDLSNTILA